MLQLVGLRPGTNDAKTIFFKELSEITSSTVLFLKSKQIIDELEKKYGASELFNVYYTAGHHPVGRRLRETFIEQDIIPIDIDGVALEELNAYLTTIAQITKTDPSKCGTVLSGNGIQYIIKVPKFDIKYFDEQKVAYHEMTRQLNLMFRENGLVGKCDMIFDPSRILRMPHTKNIKPVKDPDSAEAITKQATMYNPVLEDCGFDLSRFGSAGREKKTSSVNASHKSKVSSYKAPDADYIMTQCNFLKSMLDTKGAMANEPEWFTALGITSWFEDGDHYSHRISEGHSGYTKEETARKADHCRESGGPRSCEAVGAMGQWCDGCEYNGKIANPTVIRKGKSAGKTPTTEEEWQKSVDQGFGIEERDSKGNVKRISRDYNLLKDYFNHKHNYIRISAIRRTMIFKDNYFQKILEEEIKSFANAHFKPPVTKRADRSEFYDCITTHNIKPTDFLNSQSEGFVNMANGVLDIKNRVLLDHDPKYGFTYILPYGYDPTAKCPNWDQLLRTVTLGRQDMIDTINEFLGYCFYGGPYIHHKALLLTGRGSNGKTTLLKTLKNLIGKGNKSNLSLRKLATTFGGSGLEGKIVNISEEEKEMCFVENGDIFKQVTGDSAISVEHKFEAAFSLENRAKMIMTFNNMPILNDLSSGMLRRLLIIPFDFSYEKNPESMIPDIDAKLDSELPGILNGFLDAWDRLTARGKFLELKESKDLVNQMVISSCPVREWADYRLEFTDNEDDKILTVMAHELFREDTNSYLDPDKFSRRLSSLCKEKGKNSSNIRVKDRVGKGYKGIKIV